MKAFINKIKVFCIVFLLIIYIKLHLTLFGFGSLLDLLAKPRANILDFNKLNYVTKSIEFLGSFLPNITCLVRAATIKIIFNKNEKLKILIGISTNEEKLFESHAWVIFNNKIILNNDSKIDTYKVIHTI